MLICSMCFPLFKFYYFSLPKEAVNSITNLLDRKGHTLNGNYNDRNRITIDKENN